MPQVAKSFARLLRKRNISQNTVSPYYKTRQNLLQNVAAFLLKSKTNLYYKMRQRFYYKTSRFYYKTWQVLQNAPIITKRGTTSCSTCVDGILNNMIYDIRLYLKLDVPLFLLHCNLTLQG